MGAFNRFYVYFFLFIVISLSVNANPIIEEINLIPELEISRFAPYKVTANITNTTTIDQVIMNISVINGDGEDCWDYYINGSCASEVLSYPMIYNSSEKLWEKTRIFPDDIYPEIIFADNDVTWYNEPQDISIYRSNYHLFNFTNPFTMAPNMSFFVEFYAEPISNSNSLLVYIVGNGSHGISKDYFESDWRDKEYTELIGSVSRNDVLHHTHTTNSSHHLIPLTANPDGSIGNKNINVSDNFWVILYQDHPQEQRGWNLKYHDDSLCNNSNAWYIAERSGGTWSSLDHQTGCPDAHVHIARRDVISDGVEFTIFANYTNGDSVISSQSFSFAELPNLPPVPGIFIYPTNETISGVININWSEASDPNNDLVTYNLSLLNADGSFNRTLIGSTLETNFTWNSTEVIDGIYDLRVEACDDGNPVLCVNWTQGDLYDNFTIDNNPPIFENIPSNETIVYGINWDGVQFNASDISGIDNWWINDTNNFEINSTGFLNWTEQLALGEYYVNVSVNDTFGNIASIIYNLNITQATGIVHTYLNNSRNNLTINLGDLVLINSTLEKGIGNIPLYINETLNQTNSTPISIEYNFTSLGLYNITTIYEGNQNYTSAVETWWVNVTDEPIEEIIQEQTSIISRSRSSTINTIIIQNCELIEGCKYELRVNDKYQFSVLYTSTKIRNTHTLTLNRFNPSSAEITIENKRINLNLQKNEKIFVDFDNDGKYEIYIIYEGIQSGRAVIFIQELIYPIDDIDYDTSLINENIIEEIKEKKNESKEQTYYENQTEIIEKKIDEEFPLKEEDSFKNKKNNSWLLLILLSVIILIISFIIYKKENQNIQKTHKMLLDDESFEKIKSEKKDIEARIFDKKIKKIKTGDEIIFYKLPDKQDNISVNVIGLYVFSSFQELFSNFKKKRFGHKKLTKEEQIEKIRTLYSEEEEKKHGVVGIYIKQNNKN